MSGDAIDLLVCKVECQELIFRHGAALDDGDAPGGAALFVDDARIAGPDGTSRALADYWDRPRDTFTRFRPRVITNVVITPRTDVVAEGVAYVVMPHVPKLQWHYQFRRTDQGWRISSYEGTVVESTEASESET